MTYQMALEFITKESENITKQFGAAYAQMVAAGRCKEWLETGTLRACWYE